MEIREDQGLGFHLKAVLAGERKFESAARSVTRMILEKGVDKIARSGQTAYDFRFFRQGQKHIVGWFEEISELVNFIKDASEGGPSKELALVFVGEPGNGKTFIMEYICSKYRQFIGRKENRRFTFNFVNMDEFGKYGNIRVMQSQTFEDPVLLAMNLFESRDESSEYLAKAGFSDTAVEGLYEDYRSLGACTSYIWSDMRDHYNGDIEKMLAHIQLVPVPLDENLGTVAGKYSAGDKITSSAVDLRGDEDVWRGIQLTDTSNPYRFDVRLGALARVGGGGIHFADEIFKNKPDLLHIYLQAIQNRTIELKGYRWPVDTLIIATSNNAEYNRFISEKEQAPMKDRCSIVYVSHNTDYKLQRQLTTYVLGTRKRTTIEGEPLHFDPNLNYALSVGMTLTRLPRSLKLTPVEMMKLEAGETAGEKHIKTLIEIKKQLNSNQDVTTRWGQKGIGHRGLGRTLDTMLAMPETHEGKCLFALDCFRAIEQETLDMVSESMDRDKFSKDLAEARKLYRREIKTSIFNAFRDDPDAIRKDVMAYVNMIIGIGDERVGPDKTWRYRDPQTGELKPIKLDDRFIKSVESRLGFNSEETRESHRTTIRKIYGQRIATDPNYDFMDNESLVRAVTDVRLESDVAGAASLVGALSNTTNDENMQIRNRMIDTMLNKLGYCKTCAQKTIEYFIEKVDES